MPSTSSANSSTKPRRRSRFQTNVIAGVVALLAISSLAGCGSFTMSDSSKAQGKAAICAAGGGLVSQIRTGGATTKFVAGVIKDNSEGEIQKLATDIVNGNSDQEAANRLADYVDSQCN